MFISFLNPLILKNIPNTFTVCEEFFHFIIKFSQLFCEVTETQSFIHSANISGGYGTCQALGKQR